MKINALNPNNTLNFTSRLTYENKKTGFKREIDSKKDFYDEEVLKSLNKYLQENSDNLSITEETNKIRLSPISMTCYLSSFDNGIEIMLLDEIYGNQKLTYTKSNINGDLVPELNDILNKMDVALKKEKTESKESQSVQDKMYSFVKAVRDLLPDLISKR